MPPETISKRPLTQLNQEIDQLEAEKSRLEVDRVSIGQAASRASWRIRYLRLARWTRKPTVSHDLKSIVVLAAGSGLFAIFAFILLISLFSFSVAFLGLLIGFATCAALLAVLLYQPSDELLPATFAEAESHHQLLQARYKEKVERVRETNDRLQALIAERRDQIASGKLQKAALLQRPWKTMREAEWDDFVVEVCRTLARKSNGSIALAARTLT